MVPMQIYFWTHTYTHMHIYNPMVNSQPYTCIHPHVHTYTHTCTHTYLCFHCHKVLNPNSHRNRLYKGSTSRHDPYQKEVGQGDWMPPYPNSRLLHAAITRYYSLKREVTDWLNEGTCHEYTSDRKWVGGNLRKGTPAMASWINKCALAMQHKKTCNPSHTHTHIAKYVHHHTSINSVTGYFSWLTYSQT